jgi:L-asparaginase/Glu-tRNA(Gln) amidotransferase subunit D
VCNLHVKRVVTMTCGDAVFAATLSDKTRCQGTQAFRERIFPRIARENVGLIAWTSSSVLELEKSKEVRST